MNRHSTAASDRGLQAERTTLAWTRTAFALLVNGVLLTLKDTQGADGPAGLIPAGLAGAAASCCYVIALQRQRALSHRPLPARITPRGQVHILATAVLVLMVVTAFAQLLERGEQTQKPPHARSVGGFCVYSPNAIVADGGADLPVNCRNSRFCAARPTPGASVPARIGAPRPIRRRSRSVTTDLTCSACKSTTRTVQADTQNM